MSTRWSSNLHSLYSKSLQYSIITALSTYLEQGTLSAFQVRDGGDDEDDELEAQKEIVCRSISTCPGTLNDFLKNCETTSSDQSTVTQAQTQYTAGRLIDSL